MCMIPMAIGQAVGGRTGAIIGGALGGGVPGALLASQVVKRKNPQAIDGGTNGAINTGPTFG